MTTRAAPTGPLLGNQYSSPHAQAFGPSPPQQHGIAQPIPDSHVGIIAQGTFAKINRALMPGPVAKIVIRLQQARF